MPTQRQRPDLLLTAEQRSILTTVSRARTDQQQRVEGSRILLAYADGESISAIAGLGTKRHKMDRSEDKALQLGPWRLCAI